MRKKRYIFFTNIIMAALLFSGCGVNSSGLKDDIGETESQIATEEFDKKSDDVISFDEDQTVEISEEESTASDIMEKEQSEEMPVMDDFYISQIDDEIFARMQGLSYKDDCTIPREELRYIHILHKDFNGDTVEGELVVNKVIAEDVLEIFKELYENDYEIEKVRLVDEYNADDELSMSDNNSSAFNFRFISHTTTVSMHGSGLAIDINPLYNPYVKTVDGQKNIEPANSTDYVDRSKEFDHKIDENDLAYKLFTEHGFSWGGSWKSSKDYQHFEYNK